MLNKNDFDLWADGYDKTVGISDEENTYPFAGYRDVLGNIFQAIMEKPKATVLGYRVWNGYTHNKTI